MNRWFRIATLVLISFISPSLFAQNLDKTGTALSPFLQWELSNPTFEGNPFDLIATVTFTDVNSNETRSTEMFYAGDSVWQFRFNAIQPGMWNFTTACADTDLDGKSGTINISANPDSNAHGFLKNFANKWGWQGSENSFVPQLLMVDNVKNYFDKPDQIDADIAEYIDGHGFNGFHLSLLGGRWFQVDKSDEKVDSAAVNPDVRTFDILEQIITSVHAAGGMTHMWMWGDSSRNQGANLLAGGINGEVDRRLQRYLAARLGPIPGWSMSYGYDLQEWVNSAQLQDWHNYMTSHLGWPHFLGARAGGPQSGTDHSLWDSWNAAMDYASYEHHKPDYDVYTAAMQTNPAKPLMSEDRFRVRQEGNPKDYDEIETRRGLWHSTMAGGVANIWGNLLPDNISPSKPYKNKQRIKTWSRFFDQYKRFLPDMVSDAGLSDGLALRTNNSHFVFYQENTDSLLVDLAAMNGAPKAIAIDTQKPYSEISLGLLQSENQTINMPYNSDWAVAVGNFGVTGDVVAPAISNIQVLAVTTGSAQIQWQTDEPADSYIEFGTTTALGESTPVYPGLITDHAVSLAGLSAGTTNYFRVHSRDGSGNEQISALTNFTTLNAVFSPMGAYENLTGYATASASSEKSNYGQIAASAIDGKLVADGSYANEWVENKSPGAAGEWLLLEFSQTVTMDKIVVYDRAYTNEWIKGFTLEFSDGSRLDFTGSGNALNNNGTATSYNFSSRTSSSLKFIVENISASSSDVGLAEIEVWGRTGAIAGDSTAPQISNVQVVPTVHEATISWSTDEAASSQVEFGETSALGLATALDTAKVSQHSVTLGNLLAGTQYYYRVLSSDSSGNQAASPIYNFITETPVAPDTTAPVISALQANPGQNQAEILWQTDEPANSQVAYGLTDSLGMITAIDTALTSQHTVPLTGLQSSATYFYRAISRDGAGNEANSAIQSFQTNAPPPPDTTAPLISGVQADPGATETSISWDTDEPADSQVEFGLTTNYGSFSPLDTLAVTAHSVTLSGLVPGSTYYYRVRSKDPAGNLAVGNPLSFTTLLANPLSFSDVTTEAGVVGPGGLDSVGGHAAIWADVDGNDRADLYVTYLYTAPVGDVLFMNPDSLPFSDESVARGVDDFDGGSHGAAFADLDNDGDFDLFNGTTDGANGISGRNNIFQNDGSGFFTDITDSTGIPDQDWETRGVVTLDWDNDGDLDVLCVNNYQGSNDPAGELNELLRNDGGMKFTPLLTGALATAPMGQGGVATDFDGDGDIDIFAANRTGPVNILQNNGIGVFALIEPGTLGIQHRAEDGISTGDIDNDGDLDLLLTGDNYGELYQNLGSGTFSHVQSFTGTDGYMGAFADLDNDADLDLVFAGDDTCWLNDGMGNYSSGPAIPVSGIVDPRAVGFADYDFDGDLDFAFGANQSGNRLIRNNLNGGNQIKLALRSPQNQAGAFGAKITVRAGGARVAFREAQNTSGYLGQNEPTLTIGIGDNSNVDVQVDFLDGTRVDKNGLAAGSFTLISGVTADSIAPVISQIDSSQITDTVATIMWQTNEIATSQVFFGADATYGSTTGETSIYVTAHKVRLTGLSPETSYHFKVQSHDYAGNPVESGDLTFTTTSVSTPVISAVTANSITTNSAQIQWQTDVPADSRVQYGTTLALGTFSPLQTSMVTSHTVGLSGLSPNTKYYYKVYSKDANGIAAESTADSFQTAVQTPLGDYKNVTDIATASASHETAKYGQIAASAIDGKLVTNGDYTNEWVENKSNGCIGVWLQLDFNEPVAIDKVVLFDRHYTSEWITKFTLSFSDGTSLQYHNSGDALNNDGSATNYEFAVRTVNWLRFIIDGVGQGSSDVGLGEIEVYGRVGGTADTTAPAISNVTAAAGLDTVAISWTTDEAADGQVEYGLTDSLGLSSPFDGNLATDHQFVLSGLQPDTQYFYRVRSKDAAGNASLSATLTFQTQAPPPPDTTAPAISNVTAAAGLDTVAISWTTDEAADGQVEYGLTDSLGLSSPFDGNLATDHQFVLSGLQPDTQYFYRVRSKDAAGNASLSATLTFQTQTPPPPDTTAPVISGLQSLSITTNSAQIHWQTDELADSKVEYGTTSALGTFSPLQSTLVTSHDVALSGLAANTTYYYKAYSKDVDGNEAVSAILNFTTQDGPLLADDFTGSSLDPAKWKKGSNSGNQAVVENNALHLRSQSGTSGWVYTAARYPLENTISKIKVVQPNGDGVLGLSPTVDAASGSGFFNQPNRYRFYVYFSGSAGPTKLYVQWRKNGQVGGLDVAQGVTFTNNFFLRIRLDTAKIYFEYSFDDVNWTTAYSEVFDLPGYSLADSGYYELSAYNSPVKGELVLDDFSLISTSPPVPDTTPPVISTVQAVSITTNSAQIQWQTDEAADSQVEYGLTSSLGTFTALQSALVTSHDVALSGLAAGTNYSYKVSSKDAAGNLAVSAVFTFQTASPPPADTTAPVMTAIQVAAGIDTAAISWTTDEPADGQVDYGLTSALGMSTNLDSNLTTSHAFELSGLQPDTLYYYQVRSKDAAGNAANSAMLTFQTQAPPPPDTTAPVISGLQAVSITTNSAQIQWQTDELADSQVEYGTTGALGTFSPLQSALVTSHDVALSGLTANTQYFYKVHSKDAAGNVAVSAVVSFQTNAVTIDPGPIQFSDISSQSGAETPSGPQGYGHGVAGADYNGDGYTDIMVSNYDTSNALLINNQNGTFTDQATAWQATGNTNWFDRGISAADYNNDGFADFYLNIAGSSKLYRNSGTSAFTDVTGSSGIFDNGQAQSALWGDFNNDGMLDLLSLNYGNPLRLFIQNNDHTFTNRTSQYGLGNRNYNVSGVVFDADGDGDVDIFISRGETYSNLFFINNGSNYFNEQASQRGVSLPDRHGQGATAGDFDNDGDLDIYFCSDINSNKLLRNDGNGYFTDYTAAANLIDNSRSTGCNFADFDNDGWLDLYVINFGEANRVYKNNGDGTFTLKSNTGAESNRNGYGSCLTDFDKDGDIDIFISNSGAKSQLFDNSAGNSYWMALELQGSSSNRDAVGSTVDFYFAGLRQRRAHLAGEGFVSGNITPMHFGLGNTDFADSVVVHWPAGSSTKLESPLAGQRISIVEGQIPVYNKKSVADSTGPVISGITVSNIQATSARISWTTDEPADGRISYGLTDTLGSSSTTNTTLATSQSINLAGLQPNSVYFYQVVAKDAAGNETLSAVLSFNTAAADTTAPVITAILVSSISATTATITWSTDEPADSRLWYGLSTTYGDSLSDSTLVTSHTLQLQNLTPASDYHFQVGSADASGNLQTSIDTIFTTTAASAVLFSDDFNGSTIDTQKWDKGANAHNYSRVNNGALELVSDQDETGWVVTRQQFIAQSTEVLAHIRQPNADGDLAISPTYTPSAANGIFDEPAWYRFYVYQSGGSNYLLYVQWRKNGVVGGLDVTGGLNISGEIYLRLRMDQTHIFFDASFDGIIWTETYSEVFALSGYSLQDQFHYALEAYRTDSKGDLIVDSFEILDTSTMAVQTMKVASVSASKAIVNWRTAAADNTVFEYGLSPDFGETNAVDELNGDTHRTEIFDLHPRTTYFYRTRLTDKIGQLHYSEIRKFSTTALVDENSPLRLEAESFAQKSSGSLTSDRKSWQFTENTYIREMIDFAMAGPYWLNVRGGGNTNKGKFTGADVFLNGDLIGSVVFENEETTEVPFKLDIPEGLHEFIIKATGNTEKSVGNVALDWIEFKHDKLYIAEVEAARSAAKPRKFYLSQNYPNPFNPQTHYDLDIPETADISMNIYSITGQKVAHIFKGTVDAGQTRMRWDGRTRNGVLAASGVYILRVVAVTPMGEKWVASRRLTLMK